MAVLLASKLSLPEQLKVAKLGELLGGRIADTFSGSGSVVCGAETHSSEDLNFLNVPGAAS